MRKLCSREKFAQVAEDSPKEAAFLGFQESEEGKVQKKATAEESPDSEVRFGTQI